MKPIERRDSGQGDLLRSRLNALLDMDHQLVVLARSKRQPNRVLLSAEEEALIAGGAYLQAVQAYHEDAYEPRRSGERQRNLGIKAN